MAHVLTKDLKESILYIAAQGQLTQRDESDTPVSHTLREIDIFKQDLIKNKKIKKMPKLTPIDASNLPFDIPDKWRWVRIPEIADCCLGKTLNKAKDEGNLKSYLCSINVYWGKIVLSEVKKAAFDDKSMLKYLLKKGDLLICEGGEVGRTAVWESDDEMYYQNALHRVRFFGNINPYYMMMIFQLYKMLGILDAVSKGIGIKHLVQNSLFALPLPLPPIEEQTRIVAKVDEIMAKIDEYEKLENQLVKLKEQFSKDIKDSLLQASMMGKLTEQLDSELSPFVDSKVDINEYDYDLPTNWNVVKIMSVSDLYTGNSISASIKKSKYAGLACGFNYIGTKDVGFDCSISYDNGVKIPYDESKFKIAKKNSTLLCIEGGSAGKKIGIVSEDVCFGNKLCSFNAGEHINYKFQYYVIYSPIFKKRFIENKSGMIGGVSIKKLKEILIPLPPLEEQQRIVDKLDELLPLVDKLAELN